MKILTDTGLMVLWQRIKDLYKKISVSAKQTTTSTADGGTNVMTFTFGDGTSTTLSVKNGSKGSDGARGATGATGATGAKGEKGDRGPVGETGPQGNSGIADASNKALINDAVTGGETSYLSAEVGKLGILTYDCSKGGTVEHASLQDAINAVPTTFRKVGITIIYKSGDSIYRYAPKSGSWSSDPANWFSVEEHFDVTENDAFIEQKKDANGHVLEAITKNGRKLLNLPFCLNGVHLEGSYDKEYLYKILDKRGVFLFGIKSNGTFDKHTDVPIPTLKYPNSKQNIINYNKHQESRIYAAANYHCDGREKDMQLCLVSDPHSPYSSGTKHAVLATNHLKTVDGLVVLGDIQGWAPFDEQTSGGSDTYGIKPFMDILNDCKKPWFLVVGNHDVGPTPYVQFSRTHEQVWEDLIKPMVDNGILRKGEAGNGNDWATKCSYYHDFHNFKKRLIVLYEYGFPLKLADNDYWEPVDYDASANNIELGKTYNYDSLSPTILNCGNYKEHSFKLKKSVTTPYYTNIIENVMPGYKFRSYSFLTKEQMQWLIDTLNNTPDGYGVIIASHQSLLAPAELTRDKFSFGASFTDNKGDRYDGLSYDMWMNQAIVPKIVDAWINKKAISERIVAVSRKGTEKVQDADYLNILTDSEGKYAYKIEADFTNRTNNKSYFVCYLAGHEHNDRIERSKDFPNQFELIATTVNPSYRVMSDIADVSDEDSPAFDSLTMFACNEDRIALTKYGNDITVSGVNRDFEIINIK